MKLTLKVIVTDDHDEYNLTVFKKVHTGMEHKVFEVSGHNMTDVFNKLALEVEYAGFDFDDFGEQ